MNAAAPLLERLESLNPPELVDKVIFMVDMPRELRPSGQLNHGVRCLQFLEWALSQGGSMREALEQALDTVEQNSSPRWEEALGRPAGASSDRWTEPLETPSTADREQIDGEAARQLQQTQARLKDLLRSRSAPAAEVDRLKAEVAAWRRRLHEGRIFEAGDILADRWELVEPLGAGGFASVWRAIDLLSNDIVAVKLLHARHRHDQTMRRRFLGGARVMKSLAHPAIVPILEIQEVDEECVFFVMPHLEGGNLAEALQRKSLTQRQLLAGFRQVRQALEHAHSRKVIHRDVSPTNILLDADQSFYLADFDLARIPHATIGSAAQLGDLRFTAPEIAYGHGDGDVRSDVYSLGMTGLFALAGGELPITGYRMPTTYVAALECPPDLRQVLFRCLASEPAERFASVDEMWTAVESALPPGEFVFRPRSDIVSDAANLEKLLTKIEQHARFEAYMTQSLKFAQRVQQAFLPRQSPQAPPYSFFSHYRPHLEIGGDHYDYLPLSDGRLAVVIADVSGKGLPAAMVMARLSAEVRCVIDHGGEPCDMLSRLNRHICRAGPDDSFVTLVLGLLDPTSHKIVFAGAGHNPPLLRHSDGQVEEVGYRLFGLPLGVMEDHDYEQLEVPLAPGSNLVLFTDGVVEASNANGEYYTTQRLRELIGQKCGSADTLGQSVIDDVDRFLAGQNPSDDLTLLCVGRGDS